MEVLIIACCGVIVAALGYVLYHRQVVWVLMGLVVVMSMLALVYLLLGAEFIAVVQALVYVGGVLVLMAFALQYPAALQVRIKPQRWLFRLLSAGVLLGIGGVLVHHAYATNLITRYALLQSTASLSQIGSHMLYAGSWMVEVLGVLLLLALVGIVVALRTLRTNQPPAADG